MKYEIILLFKISFIMRQIDLMHVSLLNSSVVRQLQDV